MKSKKNDRMDNNYVFGSDDFREDRSKELEKIWQRIDE
jgi:hypothetical protein